MDRGRFQFALEFGFMGIGLGFPSGMPMFSPKDHLSKMRTEDDPVLVISL